MQRVVLIHWNAEEAKERESQLRRAGYPVELFSAKNPTQSLKALSANPPAAFVIDLARLPSHGRAVATALRQQKGTRRVPLVFVGGAADKVARVRKELPDAAYSTWRGIRTALRQAINKPPKEPLVPGTMDAYSKTPLLRKLGIRAGRVVALLGAPEAFEKKLEPVPADVKVRRDARTQADVVVLFAASQAVLKRRLPSAVRTLAEGGRLWIAWRKKAAGIRSDLTQARVRGLGMAAGLVDFKICAVDTVWSGLCFSRRNH